MNSTYFFSHSLITQGIAIPRTLNFQCTQNLLGKVKRDMLRVYLLLGYVNFKVGLSIWNMYFFLLNIVEIKEN